MIFLDFYNESSITFSAQNYYVSKTFTLTSSELHDSEIIGWDYLGEGRFIIVTRSGNFTVEDKCTPEPGVEILIIDPSGKEMKSLSDSKNKPKSKSVCTDEGFISGASNFPLALEDMSLSMKKQFDLIIPELPDSTVLHKGKSGCMCLDSLLFKTEHIYYITTLTRAARKWVEKAFSYLNESTVVCFFTYLYQRNITDNGKKMLMNWFERYRKEKRS